MKILIVGVVTFFAWSAVSNYLYVCKLRGLCNETATVQMIQVSPETMAAEVQQKTEVAKQLAVPEDLFIYFSFDKSEFTSSEFTEKYVDESSAYLKQDTHVSMLITGYTDAIGTNDYNQALGYQRAQSMQHYFVSKGIKTDKIIISSKGESEPAENNSTKEGRANNRRAVLTFKK